MNKRTIAALVGAVVLTIGCGTAGQSDTTEEGGVDIEVEDCDAEDRRNREAECGFTRSTKTPPAPAKTAAKPGPAQTPNSGSTNSRINRR